MKVIIDSDCQTVPENAAPLVSEGSALLNLLNCLGYDPDAPPLAELLGATHGFAEGWVILSPMHWQATHNDALIVAAGSDLQVQEAQARAWFEIFASYLAPEGITLHFHNAETWLLYDSRRRPLKSKPVHRLVNQSLMPELAQLDESMFWQKFITESQMLFASKPNETFMNGVWPWGGGHLVEKKNIKICADKAFLPLIQNCGAPVALYHPLMSIKEQDILLLTEFSVLSAAHQVQLKNLSAQWYWNNTAYRLNPGNRFVRLWRKLIHAY